MTTDASATTFLETLRSAAESAGVFAVVELDAGALRCAARGSAAEAWYRVVREGGAWFVELVTADRWLSESIESDLMHYGDPVEELIEEEIVELGGGPGRPVVQHYRSEDRLYTFRTPLPMRGDAPEPEATARLLLAYEAAFRQLGDMSGADAEES